MDAGVSCNKACCVMSVSCNLADEAVRVLDICFVDLEANGKHNETVIHAVRGVTLRAWTPMLLSARDLCDSQEQPFYLVPAFQWTASSQ